MRIVSLSPLATRFVVALGAGDRLVGVAAGAHALPELAHVPRVDAAAAGELAPDVLIVAGNPDSVSSPRPAASSDARVVAFEPHDLEDVFALCRGLGAELVGPTAALAFEVGLSRPLALLADLASPFDRPRVAAVVGFDPLTLAGGHSFETDLIEIGGGSSLTHGGEDERIETTREGLAALAPDLLVVVSTQELAPAERAARRAALPDDVPVAFFAYARESFWLDEPLETAKRMRALIQTLGEPVGAPAHP